MRTPRIPRSKSSSSAVATRKPGLVGTGRAKPHASRRRMLGAMRPPCGRLARARRVGVQGRPPLLLPTWPFLMVGERGQLMRLPPMTTTSPSRTRVALRLLSAAFLVTALLASGGTASAARKKTKTSAPEADQAQTPAQPAAAAPAQETPALETPAPAEAAAPATAPAQPAPEPVAPVPPPAPAARTGPTRAAGRDSRPPPPARRKGCSPPARDRQPAADQLAGRTPPAPPPRCRPRRRDECEGTPSAIISKAPDGFRTSPRSARRWNAFHHQQAE